MGKLNSQIALITGANRGIGKGIAEAFAREGASLVITARDAALLEGAAKELEAVGSAVLAIPADVTSEEQMQSLFREAQRRFGRLDLLINNAGTWVGGAPLDQMTVEAWDQVIAVNLRGPFLCIREAMKIMKAQHCGRIINIGSISAQRVRPNSAAYSASKHGIWGLTQVAALEGREYGISCGCLHPGNVLVERREGVAEPMMSVSDIAQAALAMAALPPEVNMLEAVVLPLKQAFLGRG